MTPCSSNSLKSCNDVLYKRDLCGTNSGVKSIHKYAYQSQIYQNVKHQGENTVLHFKGFPQLSPTHWGHLNIFGKRDKAEQVSK